MKTDLDIGTNLAGDNWVVAFLYANRSEFYRLPTVAYLIARIMLDIDDFIRQSLRPVKFVIAVCDQRIKSPSVLPA